VTRPRTVFFGSGSFALPALERLAESGLVSIVAVVTAPPRPAGRRGEPRPTPVAEAAARLGLDVSTPVSLRSEAASEALGDLAPALIVLADYGRLIPGSVLALPRYGALNLHPSILPRHRGAVPVPAAILAGDERTGVTLMRMDEGLDTGPIVAQRWLELEGTESAPELEARLSLVAADLLVASLPGWLSGELEARPQPEVGATLTRPLRRADGELDPTRPARELERQVRAYQPWPGAWVERGAERLVVWRASVAASPSRDALPGSTEARPGDIVTVEDTPVLVTGAGGLRLDEVQPAGRRRMSGAAYLRGRRD
jgi:methionyl-tRNA formyltransferase